MNIILKDIHQNIDQSLKTCYISNITLALCINDNGIPQNFDSISHKLLNSNSIVSNLQLIPNGVIKYIYPLKGNEMILNLNILESEDLKKEAIKPLKLNRLYFTGPLKLKQGGYGIIGSLPVYKGDKFWGFTSVVIKLDSLLKFSGINFIEKSKYDFQISKKNPISNKEEFFLPSKPNLSEAHYIENYVPDLKLKLYLIDKNFYHPIIFLILRLFLGLFISIVVWILLTKVLMKPFKLKRLLNKQEEEIYKNELKFKAMFEQSAIGIALMDAVSGDLIEVNSKFCEMMGYTRDEIKGNDKQIFNNIADIDNFNKLGEGLIKEYSIDKKCITKAGANLWLNLTVSTYSESDKNLSRFIIHMKDISIEKESQIKIEKSELQFKSIFENAPLPLWEVDLSKVKEYLFKLDLISKKPEIVTSFFNEHPGELKKCLSLIKILNLNTETLKLYKINKKALLLEKMNKFNDVESLEASKIIFGAICQNSKHFSLEMKIKNAEDEYRDIILKWNVAEENSNSFEKIIISTIDITERKTSENKIIDTKNRIKSLIDTIEGIVWEYDNKNQITTYVSKKSKEILGYSPKEWIENHNFWGDHIYFEDREQTIKDFDKSTKTNSNGVLEYRMVAKNGKIIWIRDFAKFICIEGEKQIYRGIMIDITSIKESEINLNESLHLITEQNKRLHNFSYIVSHNLKSHTNKIDSIVYLIESAESEEERNDMMTLLRSVSDSLDETITNLSEVVNVNSNSGITKSPLLLIDYVTKIEKLLSEQINSNEVSFVTNIPNDLVINYNPAYIESILYNLISNAIRYKHPERKPVIKIQCYKENEKDVIEVSDNGIGIDLVTNRDKIFGLYNTFTNNKDSRGIGLFITKNQIEAMDGQIAVESELNIGTKFKIYYK